MQAGTTPQAEQVPVLNFAPANIPAPTTVQDIMGLRLRREELSNQLVSVAGRRRQLADRLRGATDPVDRAGIQQRVKVLDNRMLQLESDIAETGRLVTSAPSGLLAAESRQDKIFGVLGSDQITGISIVFTLFVLAPMAFAAARLMWRRARVRPPAPVQLAGEASQRLERLEQSVDSVAIEVERISEGQRFVTRLLSEASQPALAASKQQAETLQLP